MQDADARGAASDGRPAGAERRTFKSLHRNYLELDNDLEVLPQ